jgi:hypothetical protein
MVTTIRDTEPKVGRPPGSTKNGPRKTQTILLKLTRDDRDKIKSLAGEAGVTVTEWITKRATKVKI